MTDNNSRFKLFYGNAPHGSCMGTNIGQSYVCPDVGPGANWEKVPCNGDPGTNLGRLAHCPQTQTGGNAGMQYTAFGDLIKDKGCGCQRGGARIGYRYDLGTVIGNRPMVVPYGTKLTKSSPPHRDYGCKQPHWSESCI